MKEKLNFVKIEATGFQGLCNKIAELEKENKELQARNDFLQRMCNGVKLNNSKLTQERNNAVDELNRIKALGMYEFADKYCTSDELEEAGHQLARSLGVGV